MGRNVNDEREAALKSFQTHIPKPVNLHDLTPDIARLHMNRPLV
jgi:hypothetical protein